jgi:hypothetical protein
MHPIARQHLEKFVAEGEPGQDPQSVVSITRGIPGTPLRVIQH